MKKFIIFIIFSFIVILALGITGGYFALRTNELTLKIKNLQPDYEKSLKNNDELKNNYAELDKKYNALLQDRDNLFAQTKNLLTWKTKAEELQQSIEKTAEEMKLLKEEKQKEQEKGLKFKDDIKRLKDDVKRLQDENKGLKDEIIQLKQTKDEILKEKDLINEAYEKILRTNIPEETDKKIKSLELENKELSDNIKKIQGEFEKLKKTESNKSAELNELRNKLAELNKDYREAVKKNRTLEQKLIAQPAKFTELARQNKALIKETTHMHYNLGVFYTKNKDYPRAISEFEKALELNPDDAYAHYNLGYIYAEYVVNRPKSIDHFKRYLDLVKSDDKDVDWVKRYILTWQAWEGKEPMK